MSDVDELKSILSECDKTGNYVSFNKRKKEFIDSRVAFGWRYWRRHRDWSILDNLLTKTDVLYFYDTVKDDPEEMKKYIDIFVRYKVLPRNLFEPYYTDVEYECNGKYRIIHDYVDTFLNKENVKYFVFLLGTSIYYYYKEKIIQTILINDDIIDDAIINKIKSMNDRIDKKYLLQIARRLEKKINVEELLGKYDYLEYCVDDDLIKNIDDFEQADINYILYYKMDKMKNRIDKLIENISNVTKIDKDSFESD